MILTTKGRYAVMAIIDLLDESRDLHSKQLGEKPISLLSISKRQNISLSYLEQIFANLRKAGIVRAVKGPGGGYVLSKKPEEITISDIISATGENIKITACGNAKSGCIMVGGSVRKRCRTHDLWYGLEQNIHNYLKSISLNEICIK